MKRKSICLFTAACMLFTSLSGISPVNADTATENFKDVKGSLLIVGGALGATNADVYEKFIELSGGADSAKIGILPTASGSLKSSYQFIADLESYGVPSENIEILPITKHNFSKTEEDESITWKDNENSEAVVNQINELTGIWMVGGDQLYISEALYNEDGSNSKALDSMWEIYKNGAVIGGSSAGAAVMCNPMIADGDSLSTLLYGFNEGNNQYPTDTNPVLMAKGLGFFPYGTVDQHFNERARLGRLISTVYEKQTYSKYGFGIDEDTALVLNNTSQELEVVGRGGVTIVDVSNATSNPLSTTTKMDSIRISYIEPGDTYSPLDNTASISEDKAPTTGYEYYDYKPTPFRGVLDNNSSLKTFIADALLDNAGTDAVYSYVYNTNGKGFEFEFTQDDLSEGYYGNGSSSYTDVILNIKPINATIAPYTLNNNNYAHSNHNIQLTNANPDEIKGNLVIMGGAAYNTALYEKFVELAGGPENAKIGIVPTASESLKSSYSYMEDFKNAGVPEENITILPLSKIGFKDFAENEKTKWAGNENSDEVVNTVNGLTGIFMVGGEQDRITNTLYNADGTNSKVLDAIWQIYKDGAVLSGSSAGAAVMSDIMLNGGDSFGTLRDGYTDDVAETYGDDLVKSQLIKGLGFFTYGMVDQHFVARGRFGRLVQAVTETEMTDKLAFGIDEDTALVVNNESKTAEVIGTSGVVVLDMRESALDTNVDKPSYENIKYSYLAVGDSIDLSTNEYKIKDGKDSTKGYEYYEDAAIPNTGALTPHSKLNNFISYELIDNAVNNEIVSYGFDNENFGFEVKLRKTDATEGFWCYTDGQKDDYSFVNVAMDIKPVTLSVKYDNTEISVPSAVSITTGDVSLKVGDTKELTIQIDGENILDKTVCWTSSNENVATVNEHGVITAVAEGEAIITVTTNLGNKTDSIKVTVTKIQNEDNTDEDEDDDTNTNNPSDNNTNKPNTDTLPQTGGPIGSLALYGLGFGLLGTSYLLRRKK